MAASRRSRETEDRSRYYYANGERVPLVPQPDRFALKFSNLRMTLSPEALAILRERSEPVIEIPHYGIKVYQSTGDSRDRAVRVLSQEPAVRFATPVFRQSERNPDPLVVTREFVAQFKPEVTRQQIDEWNARYNVEILRELEYAPNGFLLEAPPGDTALRAVELANLYYESGLTLWAHPNFVKQLRWRTTTGYAPLAGREAAVAERGDFLSQQWHLATARVTDAWAVNGGVSSIVVAILDDGVDLQHDEFRGKVADQFDFAGGVADGNPKSPDDKHGTACAGVATAAGVKAYGAAPNCRLLAVRTPQFLGVDDEARMFTWAADHGADVISCSWGPADGTGSVDPLPDSTRTAIHEIVRPGGRGRAGKGIPVFWAAGNGDELVSNDGYAANPDVIAVAASTSAETRAPYSDFGPEISICAPSSGSSAAGHRRVFTTDRRGAEGYNTGSTSAGDAAGDYTNSFGGTSSATPLAAGIGALVLSVNPDLTAAQVREILQQTADKIGSGYDASGHSQEFGYGRVNALRAVQAAGQRSGGGTATTSPTMAGPARVGRGDPPPTFQVNQGAGRFYSVEVAADPGLFDNAAARTPSNHYGSWVDTPMMSAGSYTMPQAVWDRLKANPRLYYRAWTSASNTQWVDYAVTATAQNAPSLEIDRQGTQPTGPSMQGPASVARDGAPPRFDVDPSPDTFYSVEIAADPGLFDDAAARTPSNHYGSWTDTAMMAAASYTMPQAVWDRLKGNARLHYRAHCSTSQTQWVDYLVSPSGSMEIRAARMEAASREAPAERADIIAATPGPSIVGPARLDRNAGPPVFGIKLGKNHYFGVEITDDWRLFHRGLYEAEREYGRNFFASWQQGLLRGDGSATYKLDEGTWRVLRNNDRLYYRVVTASDDSGEWRDYEASTSDFAAIAAPAILLYGRVGERAEGLAAVREEEQLWRGA